MTKGEKDWEIEILRGIEKGIQIFLQSGEDTITLSADVETAKMLAAALRGPQPDPETGLKGCWHCRNIEAHHIEYVIAVKAKGGTPMNMPVDCPYHYCPACGRKLEVEG